MPAQKPRQPDEENTHVCIQTVSFHYSQQWAISHSFLGTVILSEIRTYGKKIFQMLCDFILPQIPYFTMQRDLRNFLRRQGKTSHQLKIFLKLPQSQRPRKSPMLNGLALG